MPAGIFCVENWSGDLRSDETVLPLLDFLESNRTARVIHQRVSSHAELAHYLDRFSELTTYPIGYLAMHGTRGRVWIGPTSVRLQDLIDYRSPIGGGPRLDEELLPSIASSAADGLEAAHVSDQREDRWVFDFSGKVLYLGSCASLGISRERIQRLRHETGAIAICGYTKYVDWFEAGAADVLILSALAYAVDGERKRVPSAVRRLRERSGDLLETLGFVCEPDWRPKGG